MISIKTKCIKEICMPSKINNNVAKTMTLPCVATRDIIVHPKMVVKFDARRPKSLAALREALDEDRLVFLTAQKDSSVIDPGKNDVYAVGTVCEIRQMVNGNDGTTRVMVEGLYKAKLTSFSSDSSGIHVGVRIMKTFAKEKASEAELAAVVRVLKEAFSEYVNVIPRMPEEFKSSVLRSATPEKLYENIAFNVIMSTDDRQQVLEAPTLSEKLVALSAILAKETHILSIENDIQSKVNAAIEKGQREYYLREEMRVIKNELGEDESPEEEGYEYLEKISKLDLNEECVEKLVSEVNKLTKLGYGSQEAAGIRGYLDTVLELPWNTYTTDCLDINKVKAQLDKDHYGMKKVKERILELLAVRSLTPDVKGQIICLVGPPGVGKTSIGKSIAEALGRKYVRVSLGGIRDESDIRGHRKTYIGSMPGRIINALRQAKSKNPLILLDEIDKMANDFRGDPSSAMLEVLDSEQNKEFRDHYIELPFDLSDVLFVTTANSLDTVAPPLLDRMEIIELPSYTREEKFEIAKRHLVRKQLKLNGLNGNQLRFTDAGIYELIDFYTREAGVRTLERNISSICRKAAKEIVEKTASRVTVTPEVVEKFLGIRKYTSDIKSEVPQVGEVNGLAWTAVGGTLMPLEVLSVDGKGALELTGSLGDVMKESAKIAVTYARSVAEKYGIDKEFYTKKDIHIHAPEGAVPKDGPSAGVTLATGIISELSKIKVRSDVAMTGEITLRGRVLAIGGLREKTMAAYKEGIKTVIIPAANKPDLEEIDDKVRASLNFVFAETIEDVLDVALVKPDESSINVNPAVFKRTDKVMGARLDGVSKR